MPSISSAHFDFMRFKHRRFLGNTCREWKKFKRTFDSQKFTSPTHILIEFLIYSDSLMLILQLANLESHFRCWGYEWRRCLQGALSHCEVHSLSFDGIHTADSAIWQFCNPNTIMRQRDEANILILFWGPKDSTENHLRQSGATVIVQS